MDYDLEDRAGAAEDLAPIAQGGAGEVVTITTPGTGGTYDPATDTTSGVTGPTTQTSSGIEEAYSAFSQAQGLVQAGDVRFMMSPLRTDGTPVVTPVADRDTLTKADGVWAIKKVDPLQPAGTPILFYLQLRR
jgi:hypothetical protein